MQNITDTLNEKQKEAVFETEGYVRVIAGAGSGKTKLLVSRYAYLVLDYGIDSSNILCVTFTNKAAGEMKKRIRALIGEGYDTTLICTYHGFCNRLLRENPEKLFLNKQFQIIDSYQQKAMLTEIYHKYELKLDYASFESILHKISYFKSHNEYVSRICNPKPCQIMETIKNRDDQIIEDFLQRQKATYSLDFNDLIAFAIYILENNQDIREKWQERLNYIMVDEFQDSSAIEMRLIEILSDNYRNLMIVGDPDQNIYEWRGSDVGLLVDFDKIHEGTKTIFLNQNYRSTPEILHCANTLIEKNEYRLKKDLFTSNPNGAPVIHYHSKNDFDEMDQVIDSIKELSAKEGFKYSDFAILYRSGFLSRIAEKKLVERNIPYEIFGGVKFYQRMEILDILAYLKLIAFDDDTSFRRIINTPRRRFGRAKMNLLDDLRDNGPRVSDQIELFSVETASEMESSVNKSLFETLKNNLSEKEFQNSDVADFVRVIERIKSSSSKMRISEIVNEISKLSGYEAYIRELGDEERLDNLAEFKRIANEFEREFGEDLSLEEFLQQIALQSNEDAEGNKDTVKLMTIHASKGLEFPVVYILGFTEGIFPSSKTIEERKNLGLEEERRLCYVAITRAEKYLFLMDSEGLSQNGNKKLYSRFLTEIGEENYQRIGYISYDLEQESKNYRAKLNQNIEPQITTPNQYKIGDIVEHHIFGKGKIEEIDTKRSSYVILFDKLGQSRSISMRYFEREHIDIRSEYNVIQEDDKDEAIITGGNPLDTDDSSTVIENDVAIVEENSIINEVAFENTENVVADSFDLENEDSSFSESENDSPSKLVENEEIDEIDDSVDEFEDDYVDEVEPEQINDFDDEQKRALQELKNNSPNLWKHDDVPHEGWTCVGVEDLGAPVGICQMCGYQIIRYAHHMEHKDYRALICGCVCAGKMEGDIAGAKKREADFKNKQARRVNFFKRKWKRSKKGNDYIKINNHIVVLYNFGNARKSWKYSIDNTFGKVSYESRERAIAAAFDALEQL